MSIKFTILGQPVSKANSRQLVKHGGRYVPIKSKEGLAYAEAARYQIPAYARVMLSVPVRVTLHLYYASERSDLDESLLLDVLQDAVYVNDRQVREKHVYHHIDRNSPRAEVEVEPLKGAPS